MAFSSQHVRILLGNSAIYDRAAGYHRQRRVEIVEATTRHLQAQVRGSGRNRYTVHIDLAAGILHTACDCPYDGRCKHIGATLLAAIDSGVIPPAWEHAVLRDDEWAEDSDEEPEEPSGLHDLSEDEAHLHYLSLLQNSPAEHKTVLFTPGAGTLDRPGNHILRFVVTTEPDYRGRRSYSLIVEPMIQYIRKDGEPGALSAWRPGQECDVETRAELELLHTMIRAETRKVPLAGVLAREVLTGSPIALWTTRPHPQRVTPVPVPLRAAPVRHIDLRFIPTAYFGASILFEPVATLHSAGGGSLRMDHHLPGETRTASSRLPIWRHPRPGALDSGYARVTHPYWAATTADSLFVVDREGGALFRFSHVSAITILGGIVFDTVGCLSWPDIRSLHRVMDGMDAPVDIHLPPERVEIAASSTVPVVDIAEGFLEFSLERPTKEDGGRADVTVPDSSAEPGYRPGDRLILERVEGGSGNLKSIRDFCIDLLQKAGLAVSLGSGGLWLNGSAAEVLEVLGKALLDRGAVLRLRGEKITLSEVSFAPRVVSAGEDWLGVRMVASVEGGEAQPIEGSEEMPILRGRSGALILIRNHEDMKRAAQRFGIAARKTTHVPSSDFVRLSELEAAGTQIDERVRKERPEVAETLQRGRNLFIAYRSLTESLPTLDSPEPEGFGTILRSYQRYGLAWLDAVDRAGLGGLLADDMGLGKTIQTLAFLMQRQAPLQVLVVAPLTTLENWLHETLTFAPALRPVIHHGPGRLDRLKEERASATRLVITSYQTLLRDREELGEYSWDYVIFDETQTIKNRKTRTYQAAKVLSAKRKFALSGTPIENTTLELFAVMDLINPGFLGRPADFTRRFAGPIERDGDASAREMLREHLRPIVLRRRKADVAPDLPPRDEIPLYVALPPEQAALYESVRTGYEQLVREAMESGNYNERLFLILEGLTRLRQVALDHRLLEGAVLPEAMPSGASGKMRMVQELVPRIVEEGHRVLIFSQFVSMLSILTEWASENGYDYCYIDGSLSPAERRDEVDRFQDPDGPPIFFISIRAGGVGINLTAADYVVLMDPWWNPAVEAQAIDRTHRIGQTQPVTAYRLIAAGTVEERIAALQERKRALADDIIPDDRSVLKALTPEEVLGLFAEAGP